MDCHYLFLRLMTVAAGIWTPNLLQGEGSNRKGTQVILRKQKLKNHHKKNLWIMSPQIVYRSTWYTPCMYSPICTLYTHCMYRIHCIHSAKYKQTKKTETKANYIYCHTMHWYQFCWKEMILKGFTWFIFWNVKKT